MVSSNGGAKKRCVLDREEDTACRHRERAQSSTIGVALVFGFAIVGSVLIVALGATALGDAQQNLGEDRAEKALTQFDSKTALVALGNTDTQRVSFGQGSNGDFDVQNGTGWMRVTITNQTDGSGPKTLLNQSMGSVVYENDRMVLAYQGGGVWRQQSNNSQMISPPEFHYRNGTLTLPIVNISGTKSLGRSATITHKKTISDYTQFPNQNTTDGTLTNPLTDHKISVIVQSEYYIGWGSYFEDRTDGRVTYDHTKNRAKITLIVPANNPSVGAGLVSGSAGTTLVVDNNAEADSYNSTVSQYGGDGNVCNDGNDDSNSCPASTNTKITTAGNLDIDNNGIVYGDVEVGGDVTFGNNGELHDGNISHEDGVNGGGWPGNWINSSDNWENDNASVVDPDPVSGLINSRQDALSDPSNNNNDDVIDIDASTNTLKNCSTTCTVPSGSYYLDSVDLNSGENLKLDTRDGNIEIVVDGNFTVGNDQQIRIIGDNRTNIYLEQDLLFKNGANVENIDDDASQLWIYMDPEKDAEFRNNAIYRGVVYGPGDSSPGTRITLKQKVEIYGGLVGDINIAENNVWVHYDETLSETDSIVQDSAFPRLTYLHVSINRVEVTE